MIEPKEKTLCPTLETSEADTAQPPDWFRIRIVIPQ